MRWRLLAVIVAAFMLGALAALAVRSGGLNIFTSSAPVPPAGKIKIGGPFTLTDHTGKRVTDKDFRGRFLVIYFGYTYCPDVCPAELQVISAALDKLGEKAKRITPVFITIDPERDTVAQMAEYVKNFHPRLVGLTGSAQEIRKVAKAYRVYYAKARDTGSASDYLMDHSSIVYLMGPEGRFLAHFPYGTSADKMAETLGKYL